MDFNLPFRISLFLKQLTEYNLACCQKLGNEDSFGCPSETLEFIPGCPLVMADQIFYREVTDNGAK